MKRSAFVLVALATILGAAMLPGHAAAQVAASSSQSASDSVAINGSGGIQGQSIDQRFEGSTTNIPKPAAYAPDVGAPALTTSYNNTCHGSTSGGASFGNGAVAIGGSFGTTWLDEHCEARMDARTLKELGLDDAAKARLCQMPYIRAAMKSAGTPCPQDNQAAQAEKIEALLWLKNGESGDQAATMFGHGAEEASNALLPQCSWGMAKDVFPECNVPQNVAMTTQKNN